MSGIQDIVIVGAGAAGLAAASTLINAKRSVIVLEAKDRIGGRVFTDTQSIGCSWDHGAHWLHDHRQNPFITFAQKSGIAVEHSLEESYFWAGNRWADCSLIRDYHAYCDLVFDRITVLGLSDVDASVETALPPHFLYKRMFKAWYTSFSGKEPRCSSVLDECRYRNESGNRRVRVGFGTLLARYGKKIPVWLNTPVQRIDWSGRRVILKTPSGSVNAAAVIVTVSNAVLEKGGIHFSPVLPPSFTAAVEGIPLGEAEKIALAFDRDVFGISDSQLVFVEQTLETAQFQIRPFGMNVAIAYVAGRFARHLVDIGKAAMIDFAISKLSDVFGSRIQNHVTHTYSTSWCADPHIGGGYSTAKPGAAGGRELLGEPFSTNLFFAGEAHSIDGYGTVHGAYNSGVKTANYIATQVY